MMMEGKGVEPDFIHADGSLVFVDPQRGVDYWEQALRAIERQWDEYDALPPDEAKARWQVAKTYAKQMSEGAQQQSHYGGICKTSLYTHLFEGLTKAESMDEANAFAAAFKGYTDAESTRLNTQIQAFANLSWETIQRLKGN